MRSLAVNIHRKHLYLTAIFAFTGLEAGSVHGQRSGRPGDDYLSRLDSQGAEVMLRAAERAGHHVGASLARVAIHRGHPKIALRLLDHAASEGPAEEVRELRGVAVGLLHATEGALERTTDDQALRVQFQQAGDVALLPWLHETVVAARRLTAETMGYTWAAPTYFVLVRDQQTLSESTGLPYESARTTGTVAIAKWGRVTMLSPRAREGELAWRDTIVHEIAHLALTAVTGDSAPLWLQEGMAKDMEIRWREATRFDDSPAPEVLVREADAKGELMSLDKLGPSVAMLPSARAAGFAFAAATSFVRHLRGELGPARWNAYLQTIGATRGQDPLLEATGKTFSTWQNAWLSSIRRTVKAPSASAAAVDDGEQSVARRTRLARLLVDRGHGDAALQELARLPDNERQKRSREGGWLTLHALAHEQRRANDALDAVLYDVTPESEPLAPWYRLRARRDEARGETSEARFAREKAVNREPFAPGAVCEEGRTGRESLLCDEARRRMQPSVD